MIAAKAHRNGSNGHAAPPQAVRVGIYCRQSVTEGKDQEFGSIEAQREAVEAYALSQRGRGWHALGARYDDPGFTGANVERPAFQRLLADVRAGLIDCVAVYKIDRLSRSLADFTALMREFESRGVTFVSVTQSFDTATVTGRLLLNILASFAEFERDTIAERTRDKVRAARRKGRWTGGPPPLGYDVREKRLVVNAAEAERVREIFRLYLAAGSLAATVAELRRRGWTQKSWTTKAKAEHRGRPYSKTVLQALLTSPVVVGKLRAGTELVPGQHEPILDEELWTAVQGRLKERGKVMPPYRSRIGALLAGIVFCARCGSAMHAHYAQKRGRRFTSYVCGRIQREGAAACPGSRISARTLEEFVVSKVRSIGSDPELVTAGFEALAGYAEARKAELEQALAPLAEITKRLTRERRNLQDAIAESGPQPGLTAKLAEIEQGLADAATAVDRHRAELALLEAEHVDLEDFRRALAEFDAIWSELFPAERARVLRLLIAKVAVDAPAGDVQLDLRPSGVRFIAQNGAKEPAA